MTARRHPRHVFAALLLAVACATPPESAPARPNVLLILADDLRYDAIAALSDTAIDTPNLDRLAGRGFRFTRAYCMGSPHGAVCMPSRAMLMSGRSWHRVPIELAGVVTFPEVLRAAGYETFATGKWHNGQESFLRLFDRAAAVMFGGMSNHERVPLRDLDATGELTPERVGDGFSSTLFADAVIEFLAHRDGSRPFYAHVALTAPHDPRQAPPEYLARYSPEDMVLPPAFLPQHPFDNGQLTTRDENLAGWPRTPEVVRAQTAEYFALITHMDHEIGRILDALERTGHADDTVVAFAADHGIALGDHGLLGKQSLYEHSMHTPLIFAGPGIPSGESDAFTYLFDVPVTLCALVDRSLPEGCDGRDLAPLWRGEPTDARSTVFLSYGDRMRALRDERWKVIRYPRIARTQLFDLVNDPHETVDLAGDPQHADRITALLAKLADAQAQYGDDAPLTAAEVVPDAIDLTGHPRKPDQWQPAWIVEKYFDR